jgi:hypothetical protein
MAAILENGSTVPLKYLFKVEFADGVLFEQNSEDKSLIEPKRSAFFDVLEREKESRILRFLLTNGDHAYLVDLVDGHFEIDGMSFNCHETLPHDYPDRRLIFYRQHRHDFNSAGGAMGEEINHTVEYFIGWQTTINGKNYKETISFF